MIQSDRKSTLLSQSIRENAREELIKQVEPVRLIEALRNNDIDIGWVVERMKIIAEDGGSQTQLSALKMFIGLFSSGGMDYNLTAKAKDVVSPPPGTLEQIDAFVSSNNEENSDADSDQDKGREQGSEEGSVDPGEEDVYPVGDVAGRDLSSLSSGPEACLSGG